MKKEKMIEIIEKCEKRMTMPGEISKFWEWIDNHELEDSWMYTSNTRAKNVFENIEDIPEGYDPDRYFESLILHDLQLILDNEEHFLILLKDVESQREKFKNAYFLKNNAGNAAARRKFEEANSRDISGYFTGSWYHITFTVYQSRSYTKAATKVYKDGRKVTWREIAKILKNLEK